MNAFYHRHPELRLTAVEDEGIALHLDTRRYFSVNETGLMILEALQFPRSAGDLTGMLLQRYDAAPAHARASVEQFLTRCEAGQLVVRHDST